MAGYIVLELNHSSSSMAIYELRRGGDGVLYDTCPGWRNNKPAPGMPKVCKHTKAYVAKNPGTLYGPPGRFQEGRNRLVPDTSSREERNRPGASRKAVTPSVAPTQAAPAAWRSMLLTERTTATARGIETPREAASAYALDLDLD